MSCRVLKRDMELAMLDGLVAKCLDRGIRELIGQFRPSGKNAPALDHYARLGFELKHQDEDGTSVWTLPVNRLYTPRNRNIKELSIV